MLKLVIAVLVSALATTASANPTERIRQYHAETVTPSKDIASALQLRLPETVTVLEHENEVSLHYTGNTTPLPLANFLTTAFEQLDPSLIATGKTVSLSFVASDFEDVTEMSLMVLARFPAPELPLMKGAAIMLDGTGTTPCTGHMVLAHPDPVEDTALAYRKHLENEGFAFPEAEPDETSFFIGYRDACELALYLQEQQGSSLIVIRYLED